MLRKNIFLKLAVFLWIALLSANGKLPAQTVPVFSNVYPDGTHLFEPAGTLAFTVSSPASISIPLTGITVQLSAANLAGQSFTTNLNSSGGLTITGTTTSRSVSAILVSNAVYTVTIQVIDANGNTTNSTIYFDTISPAYTFEAEDWDYSSGLFLDNPQTNAYVNRSSTLGIDYNNPDYNAGNDGGAPYRPQGLETEQDSDTARQAYAGGKTDYDVGFNNGGNWANYTRTFPAGTYNLYLRGANPNAVQPDAANVSVITAGRGTANQTVSRLGTFTVPDTGNWQTYTWVPLLDTNGNLAAFTGGAVKTLRVTTDNGNYNANFYLLMPANTNVPVIANLYPNGTNFFQYTNQLSFTAISSAGIATSNIMVTLDGISVSNLLFSGSANSWNVSCPLLLNTNHTVSIIVTAYNGNSTTETASFNDFLPSNYQWEAEDYDFTSNGISGLFFDNPQVDAYSGLSSTADIDNHQSDLTANSFLYRPNSPAPSTTLAGDGQRSQFAAGGADYNIGFFGGGSWANYTRHYPAGTYNVWGRFAEGSSATEAALSQLISGYATSGQVTNPIGTFYIPPSGSWSTWEWVPLQDANGNLIKVRFDGSPYTLQLSGTPVGGQPEVNVNFMMLAPVAPDPFVVEKMFNLNLTNVEVIYSKPVEAASATNITNYVFAGGLAVTAASLNPDNQTVVLTTAPLVYGSNYSVVINGVRDRMNVPGTIGTNTTAGFLALPYALADIGNPPVLSSGNLAGNGLNVTAVGGGFSGTNDQGSLSYQLKTGDFDIGVRVANLGLSGVFAKAGLMARETLTNNARFAASVATPAMNGTFFEWRDPASGTANIAGSFPANYPATWLRLKRAGNVFTGFAGYDGQAWTQLGSDTITMSNQVYFGFFVSSDSTNVATTAQFRDESNVTNTIVGTQLNPHDAMGPSARTTPVVFSEILYKPAARTDGNNVEFIELYNSNPWYQDISGYQITCADMNYTFPAGTTIPGGAYLVVAASPSSITSVYGITNVMGPYTGSLKKSETLQLLDEQGSVLLTVPYSNVYPWPVAATGTGHSIVLANPTYGEGDPRAWDISDTVGGSPGQMDSYTPSPLRNVVINEILPHSENPAVPQFIELYNHSMVSNDVSGCILTDDPTTNKFIIPSGTVIPPAGFVSFTQFGFTLNGAGETLYFIKPDGSRILDAVQFGAQADGVSYGRWPDGANDFYAFTTNTPGTNNSSIVIGDIVINELMYDPISGNDDDQYIELYNKGTNTINLLGWQFTSGVTFTFPNISIAPNGYIVVGQSITNLFAKYSNLNSGNTVGNYSGKLSHNGELVQLSQPETLNGTNTIYVEEDQVTYGTGGRWGEWSGGGGSSLELIDPHANHRLAANWSDSNESAKSTWTNIETTGVLDNGANYDSSIDYAQIGILDDGECLVDNIEVDNGSSNYVSNSTFENGTNGWTFQGCMVRSSLENSGYGGSNYSLHIRSSDRIWTGDNSCQVSLSNTSLQSGQTATLRFKARWLHGWPEVLLRLNGNWLEAAGALPVPNNLGSPSVANSTAVTNAGPAIYNVTHFPSVPAANQPVVVTVNVSDPAGLQNLTLYYRLDPATGYVPVPMNDGGTNGDAVPNDGVFSATIPGQAANQVVAFYIAAVDKLGASTRFPALRPNDNEPVRECVVMFGDGNPAGSFGVYHLWLTQTNVTRWANLGNLSNEGNDCTMVNGNRVIYNMQGRFAGSPYHQDFNTPTGNLCHYKWEFNDDDKFLGATDFNKIHQPGNGAGDDPSLQREQCANTFLRTLGVPWLNRRYVAVYVNGNRRGDVMEDAQIPDSDMVKQYWPADNGGFLYKMQPWFEFAPQLTGATMNFDNQSWCTLNNYTTTGGVKKVARYRYDYLIRHTPDSASDFTNVFSFVDAANSYGTPNYVANMENVIDMENWMRVFAANHAAGNWDSFGAQNGQNLYGYIGTLGTKFSLMMWDFNIVFGGSVSGNASWLPGQNLFTVDGSDIPLINVYNTPAFLRMYWRALGELVNGPLNTANSGPLLVAKYNVFTENGFSVEDPGVNIEPWVSQAQSSIASQLAAVNATSFAANTTVTVSNNIAYLTGVAPFNVATVEVNGFSYPVTWVSVTNFVITVPLKSGANQFNLTGVDRGGNAISNDTATVSVTYNNALPSPVGNLVINEIMYAPLLDGAQFVELYNNSTNTAFDLSGWQLSGLNYTFPNGSVITPTNYLVLAANRTDFAAAYGATNPVFDLFSNALSASGETLSLIQPATTNVTVAAVQYQNTAPWPVNLNGASLQLIDPHQDNWRAGNWLAAVATPAALNSVATSLPPFQPLWLNEVEGNNLTGITNQAGQRTPWLELYNPGTTNVSLNGLYLANNYTNLTQWAFPTNANIAAGQFEVIFADGLTNLSTTNELHTGFVLSNSTGSLALTRIYNDQPQVLDYLDYNDLPMDESYGDYPDGQSFIRQTFFYPTPGGTNNGSGVQPPSSILYHSAGMIYSQNFDSLPAPGATSVNADNPIVINGVTYSLPNPFDFAFPSSATGSGGLGDAGLSGWYGYAALGSKFGATFGDQTTGGVLDFGGTNSSNRALGLIATSSTGGTAFGVKLINATGVNLNYLTVNFTGEVWRQSDTAKLLQCYYTIDPSATNVWPSAATALLPALNVTFATLKADKGGVAVDGTQSVNQTNLSVLNQAITTWPPGAALWLVWQMTDSTKLAQGLGLDNLNFSATAQPLTVLPPVSLQIEGNQVFLGSPTVSGGIYRIQYKNQLTDTNWTTLGADQSGNGTPLLLNLDTTTNAQRFYRVLLVN